MSRTGTSGRAADATPPQPRRPHWRATSRAMTVVLGSWFAVGGSTSQAQTTARATHDVVSPNLRLSRRAAAPLPPCSDWSYAGDPVAEPAWDRAGSEELPASIRNIATTAPLSTAQTGRT